MEKSALEDAKAAITDDNTMGMVEYRAARIVALSNLAVAEAINNASAAINATRDRLSEDLRSIYSRLEDLRSIYSRLR